MTRTIPAYAAAIATALGLASLASAETPSGLSDLIGSRGSSAESELQSRGYQMTGHLGSAALWWNANSQTCVSVAVDEGRVQSITSAPTRDCGKSESHGGGGSLNDLIGARGSSAESELQARGYKLKGHLGSAALWWNPGTRTCVTVAVDDGRVQSIGNAPASDCGKSTSSSHASNSGNASHTDLSDLNGMDAIRAFDVMSERGFKNVDTISAGDEIYGTYWKPSTRECIQMNSRNGRVFGIDEVPSHPKCR